ncbi:MAG: hypothetical protein JWR80_5468 [Bradyrhizobium sp.]|nr:hypothetical protein [Bradyrhizobium sp.]
MRGGTSKALMLHNHDLPADVADWKPLLLSAMGSPDPYGRQLNGMGGGASSVSKVCVIEPSLRFDADVDYTFVQVVVREARIDMSGNCGNMLSAVGPFAVDEGIVSAEDDMATVRIYNTNTRKIIHATFQVRDGKAVYDGELVIPGVTGTGAPIQLVFLEPGGATTGQLLPTRKVCDQLTVQGLGTFSVSMIDAANACVFIAAADVGVSGIESPSELEAVPGLLDRLSRIRLAASVAMGIGRDLVHAATVIHVPFICLISSAHDALTIARERVRAEDMDVTARVISNGVPHQALPLTATLCIAVSSRLEGSVVHKFTSADRGQVLRVGMPSGVLTADAEVSQRAGAWQVQRSSFFRTARPLMKGHVFAEI